MIQVRRTKYRGVEGWLVCGYPPGQTGGWPVSIFCRKQATARLVARKIKTGEGPEVGELLRLEAS